MSTPYASRTYPPAPPNPAAAATAARNAHLPKELRPPIVDPYDSFSAKEFDDWIGGITSALKRALGREDEIQGVAPEVDATDGEDVYARGSGELEQQGEDEEDSDEDLVEDSFAEWKARREATRRGKARDPGPTTPSPEYDGVGDKDRPITLDSDEEEEEEDEDEEGEEGLYAQGSSDVEEEYEEYESDEADGEAEAGPAHPRTLRAPPVEDDDDEVIELLSEEEADEPLRAEDGEPEYEEDEAEQATLDDDPYTEMEMEIRRNAGRRSSLEGYLNETDEQEDTDFSSTTGSRPAGIQDAYADDFYSGDFEESDLHASSPRRLAMQTPQNDDELDGINEDGAAQDREFLSLDEEQDELILTPGVLSIDSPSTPASPEEQFESIDVDADDDPEAGVLSGDELFGDVVDTPPTLEIMDPWAGLDVYEEDSYTGGDFNGELMALADLKYDPATLEAIRGDMVAADAFVKDDAKVPDVEIMDMTADGEDPAPSITREAPPHLVAAPAALFPPPSPFASPPKPGTHSLSASPDRMLPRAHDRSQSPPRVAPNGHVDWVNPPAFPVRTKADEGRMLEEAERMQEVKEDEEVVLMEKEEAEGGQGQDEVEFVEPSGDDEQEEQAEPAKADAGVHADADADAETGEAADAMVEADAETQVEVEAKEEQGDVASPEVVEIGEDVMDPAEDAQLPEMRVEEEAMNEQLAYIVEESDEDGKSPARAVSVDDVVTVDGGEGEGGEYEIEEVISVGSVEDEHAPEAANGDVTRDLARESSIASSRAEDEPASTIEVDQVGETIETTIETTTIETTTIETTTVDYHLDHDTEISEAIQDVAPGLTHAEATPETMDVELATTTVTEVTTDSTGPAVAEEGTLSTSPPSETMIPAEPVETPASPAPVISGLLDHLESHIRAVDSARRPDIELPPPVMSDASLAYLTPASELPPSLPTPGPGPAFDFFGPVVQLSFPARPRFDRRPTPVAIPVSVSRLSPKKQPEEPPSVVDAEVSVDVPETQATEMQAADAQPEPAVEEQPSLLAPMPPDEEGPAEPAPVVDASEQPAAVEVPALESVEHLAEAEAVTEAAALEAAEVPAPVADNSSDPQNLQLSYPSSPLPEPPVPEESAAPEAPSDEVDADAEGEIDEEYYSEHGLSLPGTTPHTPVPEEEDDPFKLMGSDSKVAPGPVATPSESSGATTPDEVTASSKPVTVHALRAELGVYSVNGNGEHESEAEPSSQTTEPLEPEETHHIFSQPSQSQQDSGDESEGSHVSDAPSWGNVPPKYRARKSQVTPSVSQEPEPQVRSSTPEVAPVSPLSSPPSSPPKPVLKTYSRIDKDKGKTVADSTAKIPSEEEPRKRPRLGERKDTGASMKKVAGKKARGIRAPSEHGSVGTTSNTSEPSHSLTNDVSWTNALPVAVQPPNMIGGILHHQHNKTTRPGLLQTYSRVIGAVTQPFRKNTKQDAGNSRSHTPTQSQPSGSQSQTVHASQESSSSQPQTQPRPNRRTGSRSPTKPRRTSSLPTTPRTTRSNCRYHKISVPKTDFGPRIHFLVPGCSLANREFMEEEEIEDLGEPTQDDQQRMVSDIETLEISAYLVHVLRILLGVDLLSEHDIYYVPDIGESVRRRKERPRESKHVLVSETDPRALSASRGPQRKRKRPQYESDSGSSSSTDGDSSDSTDSTEASIPPPRRPNVSVPKVTIKIPARSLSQRQTSPVAGTTTASASASTVVSPANSSGSSKTSASHRPSKQTASAPVGLAKGPRVKRLGLDAAAYKPLSTSADESETSEGEDRATRRRKGKKKERLPKAAKDGMLNGGEKVAGVKRSRMEEGEGADESWKKRKVEDTATT